MQDISKAQASLWLHNYGRAWEDGDPDAVVTLFTEDASYHETPFDPPLRGRAAIRRYWTEGASNSQKDVKFEYEVWAIKGRECLAHWRASFLRTPSGEPVEIDGVFRLAFACGDSETVLCRELREWWHRR